MGKAKRGPPKKESYSALTRELDELEDLIFQGGDIDFEELSESGRLSVEGADNTTWWRFFRFFVGEVEPETCPRTVNELVTHPMFWNAKELNLEVLDNYLKVLKCFLFLPAATEENRLPALLSHLKKMVKKSSKSQHESQVGEWFLVLEECNQRMREIQRVASVTLITRDGAEVTTWPVWLLSTAVRSWTNGSPETKYSQDPSTEPTHRENSSPEPTPMCRVRLKPSFESYLASLD